MTSISSIASVYIPTTVSTAAPAPVATTPDTSSALVAGQAAPTNANTQAPAVYTALANESASTIRGSNLNIST